MPRKDGRDLPMALLDTCVRVFGSSRPEWGRAMTAELERVDGRYARWVFALGCVRTLAFRMPAVGSEKLIAATGLAAAAGSMALVLFALIRYPDMVSGARTWVEVGVFAALLLVYAGALAHLCAGPGDGRATLAAVGTGAAIAVSWLIVGLDSSLGGPKSVDETCVCLGVLAALAIGWFGARRSGSGQGGVRSVGIAGVIAGFSVFVLWSGEAVATAGRPYDAGLLRDFKASGSADLATYAVNDSLGTGMVLVLLVPLLTLSFGLAGVAVANASRSRLPA